MSSRNAVLWKDGLFVKPQHFQQLAYSNDAALQHRITSISDVCYGFSELDLNAEYLGFGKIAINRARGVMPDGTVFDIPGDTPSPKPLEIRDSTVANEVVYLCLPLREAGVLEVHWPNGEVDSRYIAQATTVFDTHSIDGDAATLDLAVPNLQLKLGHEDRSAYIAIAVAKILGKRADGGIVLDRHFHPTCLSVRASPGLQGALEEFSGLMRERARNIAARVCSPGQSGVADVTDFNLLQVMNRLYPYFLHLSRRGQVHPEQLYVTYSQACGELVTFTDDGRLPQEYPAYQHDNLTESFRLLEETLRRALSTLLQPRAVALPIVQQAYGVRTATVHEHELLNTADFILAVRSALPCEELRQRFVAQAKVTSIEGLTDLIRHQLPGVPLTPLPVAPRHLPFHSGFSYFELDRRDSSWEAVRKDSGFGFHITGDFPELELQFWAVRDQ